MSSSRSRHMGGDGGYWAGPGRVRQSQRDPRRRWASSRQRDPKPSTLFMLSESGIWFSWLAKPKFCVSSVWDPRTTLFAFSSPPLPQTPAPKHSNRSPLRWEIRAFARSESPYFFFSAAFHSCRLSASIWDFTLLFLLLLQFRSIKLKSAHKHHALVHVMLG